MTAHLVCFHCRVAVVQQGDGPAVYSGQCRGCYRERARREFEEAKAASDAARAVAHAAAMEKAAQEPTYAQLVEAAQKHESECLVCVKLGASFYGAPKCVRLKMGTL